MMPRVYRLILCCLALCTSLGPAPRLSAAERVHVLIDQEQAVALTRRTGRPLLAIGGTVNCVYCVRMAKQLESDEAVAPFAAKYVILKIDTSSRLWREWREKYDIDGDGVPQVVILRADGKQIYGKTGAPADLQAFLQQNLADAGVVLTNAELADREKLLREAQKHLKKKDYAKATELGLECVQDDCHAAVVVEARKLLDNLDDRAVLGLKEAERKLASRDKTFEGALALLELEAAFGEHPSAKGRIQDALERHAAGEEQAPLFMQARQVREAQRWETAKQRTEAIAAWKQVLDNHPNTPAASLATRRLADLEKREGKGTSGKASEGTSEPEGSAADRRATSLLKLGQQLLYSKPAAARDYLQRAIEEAPESKAAAKARELLESLD
jgi:hypothetical protein